MVNFAFGCGNTFTLDLKVSIQPLLSFTVRITVLTPTVSKTTFPTESKVEVCGFAPVPNAHS